MSTQILAPTTGDWLLRQARLRDDLPLRDLLLTNGEIAALGPNLVATATNEWDLAGRVILPGMVDLHTHLDKTYSSIENQSGTLQEAIELWDRLRRQRTPGETAQAAHRALQAAVANGVTAMRSHLTASDPSDLPIIEALMVLCEEMRDAISVQYVALGHLGESTEKDAVMQHVLDLGADYVGGAPALSADPIIEIDAVFALAERLGKPIDLHIDETEDPNTLTLEYVAEKTLAHGMQGLVTVGHCCSLEFCDAQTVNRVVEKVAKAELNIVTLPSCNLVLIGRGMKPTPRGITAVKALLQAGVNVCAGSDNVHDPFNPFGSYDLLQIANLTAHVAHMTGEPELNTCLAMVTSHPACAFGNSIDPIGDSHLRAGRPADLVVVDALSCLDAITAISPRLATFKAGKLIVQTKIERNWFV